MNRLHVLANALQTSLRGAAGLVLLLGAFDVVDTLHGIAFGFALFCVAPLLAAPLDVAAIIRDAQRQARSSGPP